MTNQRPTPTPTSPPHKKNLRVRDMAEIWVSEGYLRVGGQDLPELVIHLIDAAVAQNADMILLDVRKQN